MFLRRVLGFYVSPDPFLSRQQHLWVRHFPLVLSSSQEIPPTTLHLQMYPCKAMIVQVSEVENHMDMGGGIETSDKIKRLVLFQFIYEV